mmetsp:Transcript_79378/g.256622  ORF Transcript_79378/g.256622 Transcript_79378/m.256622 type:complete len:128 (+) Transcript_79378:365-748(+)
MFQQWLPQGSCARHQVMSESNGALANTEPCIERDMLRRPKKNIAPAQHAHANAWPRAGTLMRDCETPDNCVSPFAAMPRGTASKTVSPCPSGRLVCPAEFAPNSTRSAFTVRRRKELAWCVPNSARS